MSSDSLWAAMMDANDTNDIIIAGTEGDDDTHKQADGTVKGHAYTVLHAQELSNGAKLLKLRNPWGSDSRNKGDYSDDSSLWTENLKREAGFTKADDGITWMTIEDFKRQFGYSMVNLDTTNMHHAAFLKLDDNSTDRPGETSNCGAKCIRHVVKFTSTVAQKIYFSAHLWDARGQPRSCNPRNHSIFYIYNEATYTRHGMWLSRGNTQHNQVLDVTPNQTVEIELELDFTNETVRDWSLVAWGD